MAGQRAGWAWGDVSGGAEWLTIRGSALEAPELHATQDEAQAAFKAANVTPFAWQRLVVARVTEVYHSGVTGPRPYAYRIHEIAA